MSERRRAFGHYPLLMIKVIGVLICSLLLLELLLRVLFGNLEFTPSVFAPREIYSGYGLRVGAISHVRQFGEALTIGTDTDGRRVTINAIAGRVPIHIIGDSQVFGWGLSDDQTIASQLQQRVGPHYQIINHGVPGYGPLDYITVLNAIPRGDMTIVLHTEENDLWDSYGLQHDTKAVCGYMSTTSVSRASPCIVMHSRLMQFALEWLDQSAHKLKETPLGMSDSTRVAGRVTAFRVHHLYDHERQARGACLQFSVVPWKARYDIEWRTVYAPPPLEPVKGSTLEFDDDLNMLAHFDDAGKTDPLYIKGDPHLSAAGAKVIASVLATAISNSRCPSIQRASSESADAGPPWGSGIPVAELRGPK
jgi:hypothetical protein